MNPAHPYAKYVKKRMDHPRGQGFRDMTPERRAEVAILRKLPLEERFWRQVDKSGECWIWKGSILKEGYGQIWVRGRMRKAHHIALELMGLDPTKDGNVVDHICRTRACVRPDHLRIVPMGVNSRENNLSPFAKNSRKIHCKHGHEFTPENTAIIPKGRQRNRHGKLVSSSRPTRVCLTCWPAYWKYAIVPRNPPPGVKPRPWRKRKSESARDCSRTGK